MPARILFRLFLACVGVLLSVWSLSAHAQAGPPPAPVTVEQAENLAMRRFMSDPLHQAATPRLRRKPRVG